MNPLLRLYKSGSQSPLPLTPHNFANFDATPKPLDPQDIMKTTALLLLSLAGALAAPTPQNKERDIVEARQGGWGTGSPGWKRELDERQGGWGTGSPSWKRGELDERQGGWGTGSPPWKRELEERQGGWGTGSPSWKRENEGRSE